MVNMNSCVVGQSVTEALLSLLMVYPRRNLSADQCRNAQLLSLLASPAAMLSPACCDTVCTSSTVQIHQLWVQLCGLAWLFDYVF